MNTKMNNETKHKLLTNIELIIILVLINIQHHLTTKYNEKDFQIILPWYFTMIKKV